MQPVFDLLENRKYAPWFDKHHYPAGQGAFEALREGIIHSRHVVFFVTAKFLAQGRGWNSVECAYSNLIQENLRFTSLELCHIQLPLFFVPQSHPVLQRSVWATMLHRGSFYTSGRVDSAAVNWAYQQIVSFIRQEERRGLSLAEQVQNDPGFQPWLASEPNFLHRVMCADPPPFS